MNKWLKKKKTDIILHSFIITAFVIFIIFGAEPLFNRINAVPGEARIQNIPLPPETYNINYAIDRISINQGTLEIEGWAYIEGQNATETEKYIVLKSGSNKIVFNTLKSQRQDVTRAFSKLNLDLDESGFITLIPIDKIKMEEYLVGICIRKGSLEALQYTDKALLKSNDRIEVTLLESELEGDIEVPQESEGFKFSIDRNEIIQDENGKEFLEIVGWAFIEGQDAKNSKIYLVIKSPTNTFIFSTFLRKRPDVTEGFKESGSNLSDSGFITRIAVQSIAEGEYALGILIENGNYKYYMSSMKNIKF